MRIALVIPAWSPEEIFNARTAGSQINYWQPLGTLYVAATLLEAGHDVRFLNGAFLSHDEIMARIDAFAPKLVGLYSTAFGWDKALRTAGALKAWDPSAYIIVGGPYPIAMRGKCIEEAGGRIDAVVTGEGEITVREIAAALASGASPAGIQGVVCRTPEGIVDGGDRPLIEDLDSLPFPARDLLGNAREYVPPPATYRRKPVAVVITSRGCNRRCIYCFQIDRERKSGVRFRSVENVLDEIDICLRQGYREIKFIDDTLAADYDRAMMLCEGIRRRGLHFTWFASACVNQVDERLLKAFRGAGCWAILFGAESGVQRSLNTIRKGIRLDQTREAVRAAKSVGLTVLTPFLFGIPGETFEDGLATIDFACELNPDIANFHALTPFPGTELYDNIERYGTISGSLADYTYQGIAFTPHSMTRDQIAELRQIAFRRFYSRPSYLFRRLMGIRTLHDLAAAASGLKSLFWIVGSKGLFKRD